MLSVLCTTGAPVFVVVEAPVTGGFTGSEPRRVPDVVDEDEPEPELSDLFFRPATRTRNTIRAMNAPMMNTAEPSIRNFLLLCPARCGTILHISSKLYHINEVITRNDRLFLDRFHGFFSLRARKDWADSELKSAAASCINITGLGKGVHA